MEATKNSSQEALAEMFASKVRQAMANGATEDQAIAAVRSLWLEHLASKGI